VDDERRVTQSPAGSAAECCCKDCADRDGSFFASNLPGLFFVPGHRDARMESGSGTWILVTHDGEDQVQLDFREIADWKTGVPYGTQLNISRGWSGITLYYFLGDADEGVKVDLEKKLNSP